MKLINNFLDNLPQHNTSENNTTKEDSLKTKDSPPPTLFSGGVNLLSENTTGKELEISQQLFNTTSTLIQQPQNVELDKNGQTAYETKDAEAKKFIQHTTKEEGERGCVEQSQFNNVLQT